MENKLIVSPSPHRYTLNSTAKVMLLVIAALLPSAVMGCVIFGGHAAAVLVTCVVSCVVFEALCRIIMKRPQTVSDCSAAVTGLLLGMNLPSEFPLWMAVIGSFAAIVIAKQLFGGIGQNFANPAIVGRIVLMLSFTQYMSSWPLPYWYKTSADAVTGATPLADGAAGFSYTDLLLGNCGGCIGEVCALALMIGGVFLVLCGVISPVTPVAFIGTVALLAYVTGGDPLYQILSGGLMIGAFFMATDYATTPLSGKGKLIFGIGCGIITFVIREYGNGYPEGVSFSILLMNLLTPYIDRLTATKPLGARPAAKEGKV